MFIINMNLFTVIFFSSATPILSYFKLKNIPIYVAMGNLHLVSDIDQ